MTEQIKQKSIIEMFLDGELDTMIDNKVLELNKDEVGCEFTLLTEGDITLLYGPPSSGKSRMGAYFLRQFLIEKPDKFFVRKENGKKYAVVYIDTEMSGQNLYKYFVQDNFYEYESIHLANENLQLRERFKLLAYSQYSIEERKVKLKEFIDSINKEKYNYIFFLDNLASFTDDPNNTINNRVVNEIKSMLSGITMFVVLHSNHKENANKNNATGAIGTITERLAANYFQITNPKNQKFILELKKSKSQPDKIITKVCVTQVEKKGMLIMGDICEVDDSMEEEKKDRKKVSDTNFSNMILDFFNKKPLNSPDRQRKSLVFLFEDYYKEKMVYDKVKALCEKGVLSDSNGYLIHKSEDPF